MASLHHRCCALETSRLDRCCLIGGVRSYSGRFGRGQGAQRCASMFPYQTLVSWSFRLRVLGDLDLGMIFQFIDTYPDKFGIRDKIYVF